MDNRENIEENNIENVEENFIEDGNEGEVEGEIRNEGEGEIRNEGEIWIEFADEIDDIIVPLYDEAIASLRARALRTESQLRQRIRAGLIISDIEIINGGNRFLIDSINMAEF